MISVKNLYIKKLIENLICLFLLLAFSFLFKKDLHFQFLITFAIFYIKDALEIYLILDEKKTESFAKLKDFYKNHKTIYIIISGLIVISIIFLLLNIFNLDHRADIFYAIFIYIIANL